MTSLLDVNVLISLLDTNHEHHAATKGWWNNNQDPWASCPITQNGYLRVVTGQKYPNAISINQAIQKLTQVVSTPKHQFLHDDITLLNNQLIVHNHIQGYKQITDVYLLALSVQHGARFVTLDKSINKIAVLQATDASCKCRRKSAVICRGSAISLFRASPYSFWNFPWGLHECATLALRLRKTR